MKTQTSRFEAIIREPTLKTTNPQERPHVRFDAHRLMEVQQCWAHDQNDALGYLLYFRCLIANELREALDSEELRFFQLFPVYFRSIQYWEDKDSGVWEEARRCNSSSVGAVIAGLTQLRRFYQEPWDYDNANRVADITDLIAKGQQTLAAQLPFESRSPTVKIDAAPLLLIYPAQVVTDMVTQDLILSLVRARLVGPKGVRRYVGDSYFCQDYDEWFTPETRTADFSNRLELRDAFLMPGCEAQWCLFDPLLSVIYGRRFLATDARRDFEKQLYHFNRAIGQLTPEGQGPELYFLKHGEFVPNEHTPLAWTQANLALAVHFLEQSVYKLP
jgi:phosphorylase kinase alpha/beta subunit